MDLSKTYQQYGFIAKGKGVNNYRTFVNGIKYNDVIDVHTKSIIKLNLRGNSSELQFGTAVLKDTKDINADYISACFLTDGKRVFYDTGNNKAICRSGMK
ncbi:MAG: hypothetical protein Q4F97_05240 [Bacteroidales bacterium]|nr:hypothetical protein [Bacteroidales bacterium]